MTRFVWFSGRGYLWLFLTPVFLFSLPIVSSEGRILLWFTPHNLVTTKGGLILWRCFITTCFWGGEQEPFRHFKAPNATWGCRVVMPHLDGAHPVAPAGIYSIPRECEAGFVALAGLGTRQSCRGWRLSLGHTEQLQDLGWDHHRVEIWVLGTAWSLARNQRGSVVRAGINFGVHHPVFPFPWALESRALRNIPPAAH